MSKLRRHQIRRPFALLLSAVVLSSITTAVPAAGAVDGFQSLLAPFECGSEWSGGTRSGHGFNNWNLDINRTSRTYSDPQHDLGQPLLAQADGVVTWLGVHASAGTYIDIDYGDYTVRYVHLVHESIPAHLDQIGAPVAIGELIGLLGDTGNATHAHLHLEYFDSRAYDNAAGWRIPDNEQVQIAMAGELIDPGESFVSTNCSSQVADTPLERHIRSLVQPEGRASTTAAARSARAYLIEQLQPYTEALDTSTDPLSYEDDFGAGTNLIARVPGSDLAHEIVMIGAHYDTLADCDGDADPGTVVACPGATDNAAGAAILLELAKTLGSAETGPRRTVVFAFWDRAETALTGAESWTETNSPGLVDNVVAYLDYDKQGASLSLALRSTTFAVGAASGGTALGNSVGAADHASLPLNVTRLDAASELSTDAATFVDLGIPTVGFTDRSTACTNTVDDTTDLVDITKLQRQLATGIHLATQLATTDSSPVFEPLAGPTPDEAAALLGLVTNAGISGLTDFNELATIVGDAPSALDPTQAAAVTAAFISFDAQIAALGCSSHRSPAPFTDLAAQSYALADVGLLYDLAITTGTSPTTYSPHANVTREQMAAFLARLWQALNPDHPDPPDDHPFTDVDPDSFALPGINLIYDLAITTGTSPTTYSPHANVTREQMAAFLARLLRAAGAG